MNFSAPGIPIVVAYGMGVDSTAMLVEMSRRGMRPDLIMFADTGGEKQETYDYYAVIQDWLASVGFPSLTVVRYVPRDFKNWPPYYSLGENCLTNGTLPSLAFGFKSCSQKWKVAPQNKYCERWQPARRCWSVGWKVRKLIGYDSSPADRRRFAVANELDDPQYTYEYPLIEWNWDRERCKAEIAREGLPVPPKSACYFCPATKPAELHDFKKIYLRYIVIMESRAAPRLTAIQGLWRNGVKGTRGGEKKPGRMTDYIRDQGLLPSEEIDELIARAPSEILQKQSRYANGEEIPKWHDFIEAFTPEDAVDDGLPRIDVESKDVTNLDERREETDR